MIREAIKRLIEGKSLSREEASSVMAQIMEGKATEAQIGAFLVALRLKGETAQEIAGFAQTMRNKATPVPTNRKGTIDVCGTGGDGFGSFNISTIAALVIAGCGVPVAKHGNRSVSSKCGSADLLQQLGVKIDLPAEKIAQCLDEIGIAFLFAPMLHQAMKYAIGPRREIGVRTVFNVLGPITNPAGTQRQLIGVYDRYLANLLAEVLRELETEKALIVYGEDGLDEVSITTSTYLVELSEGNILEKKVTPEDFGLTPSNREEILGGGPEENASIALEILKGKHGPTRDVVIANAACGLYVAGSAASFIEGAKLAAESIDSGAALDKLEQMRRFSNG